MNLRMWGSHYTQLLQLREPLSYVTVNIRIGPLLCSHTCMVRLLFTEQLPEPSYRGLWQWIMARVIDAQTANVDKSTTSPHAIKFFPSSSTYSWLHLYYTLTWFVLSWPDLCSDHWKALVVAWDRGWWLEKGDAEKWSPTIRSVLVHTQLHKT